MLNSFDFESVAREVRHFRVDEVSKSSVGPYGLELQV